jgi:hypothetical protein
MLPIEQYEHLEWVREIILRPNVSKPLDEMEYASRIRENVRGCIQHTGASRNPGPGCLKDRVDFPLTRLKVGYVIAKVSP